MNEIISSLSDFLWTYILIAFLILCGLYFSIRTRFVQFRLFGEMFRLLGDSATNGRKGKEQKHISSFQAFAVSLATRVGCGNLAGVATAIAIGGPGAVFWMWITALVGAATSFVESTLAQLFKQPHEDSFIGGPAYYISKGLHSRTLSYIFAVLIILAFGITQTSIQSNTIAGAMQEAFGIPTVWVGAALAIMALFIAFGGIQRIAFISSILVPIMAFGYLILALFIVVVNIKLLPGVLGIIVKDAFGLRQAAGGLFGATILMGVKRGLFSNEAGEGSVPNVAATANVTHPVKQGLVQSLGVLVDTIVVCSCTAFIILISGLYNTGLNGIALTQNALESEIGSSGPVFIAVAIFLFAFSTIIGNYYYGEANIRFMTKSKGALTAFRVLSAGVSVFVGAILSLEVVWGIGDLFMALNTACNLFAIALLGKYAFRLLDDYTAQKKRGVKEPSFSRKDCHEVLGENLDLDAWE